MRRLGVSLVLASTVWLVAIWALHGQAFAAKYYITDVENLTAQGFRTSVFHKATSNGGKSGKVLEVAKPGTASGTWDDVTGAFKLDFGLKSGKTVSANGNLLLPGNNDAAVVGNITFSFSEAVNGLTTHAIKFLDWSYNVGVAPQPNSSNGLAIALWGASGTPTSNGNFDTSTTGLGADLRIALAAAPLPAALPLLASGMLILGWFGWRRKRNSLPAASAA